MVLKHLSKHVATASIHSKNNSILFHLGDLDSPTNEKRNVQGMTLKLYIYIYNFKVIPISHTHIYIYIYIYNFKVIPISHTYIYIYIYNFNVIPISHIYIYIYIYI